MDMERVASLHALRHTKYAATHNGAKNIFPAILLFRNRTPGYSLAASAMHNIFRFPIDFRLLRFVRPAVQQTDAHMYRPATPQVPSQE